MDAMSEVQDAGYSDATTVVKSGTYISQSRVMELKTCKARPSEPVTGNMAQFYFGRKYSVAVGEHKEYERILPDSTKSTYTAFHEAKVHDLKEPVSDKSKATKMAAWEKDKQKVFKQLCGLLERQGDHKAVEERKGSPAEDGKEGTV